MGRPALPPGPAPSPISSPGLGGALGREAAIVLRWRFPQQPAEGRAVTSPQEAGQSPAQPWSAAARNALGTSWAGAGSAETRRRGGVMQRRQDPGRARGSERGTPRP